MPSNPTTKSQVQAYRFMLRRMESALVRKDAVMLHEPMRNHLRASAVGLILAVLGLAAFFVLGLFKSRGDIEVGDIVQVDGTTRVLVAVVKEGEPDQKLLVPASNVTSARLLVLALDPGTSDLKTKPLAALDSSIPILPEIGLEEAPRDLPDPKKLIDGFWSVCDTAVVRQELPNAEANPELSTTVVIGGERGDQLRTDQALLLEDSSSGAHYLVWNGKRLPVELDGPAVRQAYELGGIVPRKVSTGLLNAIPQGDPLAPPDVPGAGDPFAALPGVQVGDVVRVDRGEDEYFLILKQGKQKVEHAVAGLIRSGSTSIEFEKASPEAMDRVPDAPRPNQLNFADFPPRVPPVLGVTDMPVTCLVWRGADQKPVITASANEQLLGNEGVAVPDADERQAGRVVLQGGSGALVYGVVESGQQPNTGQIWLVTDQGQKYGVPSPELAGALLLDDQVRVTSAPESILKLLQQGPVLDPEELRRQYELDPE